MFTVGLASDEILNMNSVFSVLVREVQITKPYCFLFALLVIKL